MEVQRRDGVLHDSQPQGLYQVHQIFAILRMVSYYPGWDSTNKVHTHLRSEEQFFQRKLFPLRHEGRQMSHLTPLWADSERLECGSDFFWF